MKESLEPGRVIGNYRVGEAIGRGGLASIWEAERLDVPGVRVALKVLHADAARQPEILAAFCARADAMASLSHPNIVATMDVITTEDAAFVAMELLRAEPLTRLIRDGLTHPQIRDVLRHIAAALDPAHGRGVFHGDLLPENVIVDSYGFSKVLGFRNEPLPGGPTCRAPYAPPEHLRGERLDHRSDIYSLGVMVFEMLTRRYPFEDNLIALHRRIAGPPPSLRASKPSIGAALDLAVQKALSVKRDERYQSAGEMAEAVSRLLDT